MVRSLVIFAILIALILASALQVEAVSEAEKYLNLLDASLQGDAGAAEDIEKFFAGHPVPMREIRQELAKGFHKIAWKIPSLGENAWIIVEENLKQPKATKWHVIYAANPPADAKIIQTKYRR